LEKGSSHEEHEQVNKGVGRGRGEEAEGYFYCLKIALQIKRYGMARCPDAKSTRFSTNLAVSSSLDSRSSVKISIE
jgi:hypothetical protein